MADIPRQRKSIEELTGNTRDRGVRCPKCECRHCPVTRTKHAGSVTIRERRCRYCRAEFTTREFVQQ